MIFEMEILRILELLTIKNIITLQSTTNVYFLLDDETNVDFVDSDKHVDEKKENGEEEPQTQKNKKKYIIYSKNFFLRDCFIFYWCYC